MSMIAGNKINKDDIGEAIKNAIGTGNLSLTDSNSKTLQTYIETSLASYIGDGKLIDSGNACKISDVINCIYNTMWQACRIVKTDIYAYPKNYTNGGTPSIKFLSTQTSISTSPTIDSLASYTISADSYLDSIGYSQPTVGQIIKAQKIVDLINYLNDLNNNNTVTSDNKSTLKCYSSCHKDCHGSSRGRR